jgi:hypothetical protein
VVFGEGRGQLSYATTHGDSMLFACGIAILVAALLEQPSRREVLWRALSLVIIIAGIVANDRRLAWVQVAASCVLIMIMNRRTRAVRGVLRCAIYVSPLVLAYGVAGWNSSSKIFAPVGLVRSMTDSDTNRSTWYRDAENYDLLSTFRANPVMGTGFGHPFETPLQLDDISKGFKEWRYLPHNSILGLWAFTGGVGFTGLWWAFVVGLMLAARSHRFAQRADLRIAASAAMASIVIFTIHCWGDIGFTEPKSIFLVGSGLAMAGQLAASTGAWRHTAADRRAMILSNAGRQ